MVVMNLKFLCACQILAQYHRFTVLQKIMVSILKMEFVKLAMAVMSENNLLWPSNRDESETLFLKLTNVLGSIQ